MTAKFSAGPKHCTMAALGQEEISELVAIRLPLIGAL